MGTFVKKYLMWFKIGGAVLVVAGIFFFGMYVGNTSTELKYTNRANGELTQKVGDMEKFMVEYQSLVKQRDALMLQYNTSQAQNAQLMEEQRNASQNSTLQLINTLRNPTDGLYAENANCGEAGNYPEVFGQFVSPTAATTRN